MSNIKISRPSNNNSGRKSQWLVTFSMIEKSIRRFFRTCVEAAHVANEDSFVNIACDNLGSSSAPLISPETTLAEAARMYLARQDKTYVRRATAKRSTGALHALVQYFGKRTILSISECEIERYIDALKNSRGEVGQASPHTKLRTLAEIKRVYRGLGIARPLASVRRPVLPTKVQIPPFYSGDQFVAIMSAARPEERGMIALGCICGIPLAVLERLPAGCVDPVRRCIMIPGYLSKDSMAALLSTESHNPDHGIIIPGLPSVIWAWLKHFPFEPRQSAAIRNRIAAAIGYRIQDGCRNTAANYYCALNGAAAANALLFPNREPLDVTRHYVSQFSQADAERFYKIDPAQFLPKQPI